MKPNIGDKALRDAVLEELDQDPEVSAKHISVIAIDGAVALGGHVPTYHEKHAAVRAAERVQAVRAVADRIDVNEPSLHERADDEIAEEVAHLRGLFLQSPDSVAVQVRDGRVILHGQVESESQRATVEKAARQLTGVQGVSNLIEVRSPAELAGSDVERRVNEALAGVGDPHRDSITATMSDSTARLHGRVSSLTAWETALHAAESAPGVTAVESEIVVAP